MGELDGEDWKRSPTYSVGRGYSVVPCPGPGFSINVLLSNELMI